MNAAASTAQVAAEVLNLAGRKATKRFRKQAARAQREATRTQRALDKTSVLRFFRRARLRGRLEKHRAVVEMAAGIGEAFPDRTVVERYSGGSPGGGMQYPAGGPQRGMR